MSMRPSAAGTHMTKRPFGAVVVVLLGSARSVNVAPKTPMNVAAEESQSRYSPVTCISGMQGSGGASIVVMPSSPHAPHAARTRTGTSERRSGRVTIEATLALLLELHGLRSGDADLGRRDR